MKDVVRFTNKSKSEIEILIEPYAEYIDLAADATISFEIYYPVGDLRDPLEIEYRDRMILVYEQRERRMDVFINGELKFTNVNY